MAAIINVEWQNNFADAVPGRFKKKKAVLSGFNRIYSPRNPR